MPELLTLPETLEIVRVSRNTLYRIMRRKDSPFPRPLKLGGQPGRSGGGTVRWRADEVEEWIRTRPRAVGIEGR